MIHCLAYFLKFSIFYYAFVMYCSQKDCFEVFGFNFHLHILASDGGFEGSGMFYASGTDINAEELEPLFRHKVQSMLKKKRLITDT